MPDFGSLLAITATFFIVAVSPGPATISNAVVAMHFGRRAGIIHGLGLTLGLAFWGVIAASGLGVLLKGSLYMMSSLKVLGGLYLIWLAWRSFSDACRTEVEHQQTPEKCNWFLKGMTLNLSNPKAVLAWMAALSVGLSAEASPLVILLATVVCSFSGFLVYLIYSYLFSMGGVMAVYQRSRRWIEGAVATMFLTAGVGLIRSSFNNQ